MGPLEKFQFQHANRLGQPNPAKEGAGLRAITVVLLCLQNLAHAANHRLLKEMFRADSQRHNLPIRTAQTDHIHGMQFLLHENHLLNLLLF